MFTRALRLFADMDYNRMSLPDGVLSVVLLFRLSETTLQLSADINIKRQSARLERNQTRDEWEPEDCAFRGESRLRGCQFWAG